MKDTIKKTDFVKPRMDVDEATGTLQDGSFGGGVGFAGRGGAQHQVRVVVVMSNSVLLRISNRAVSG